MTTENEKELKILLVKKQYDEIRATLDGKSHLQINHYFASGWAKDCFLRIRQKDGKFLLTVKKHIATLGNVKLSEENSVELTEKEACRFFVEGISDDEVRRMGVSTGNYVYCGSLSTVRTVCLWSGLTVELDCNCYLGTVDYELECESTGDDELLRLQNYLQSAFGVECNTGAISKSERFFDRLKKLEEK